MASCQTRLSNAVQTKFYNAFYAWGTVVARSPKKVIIISLIVTFIASLRLLAAPARAIETETRQEKLFAPQDSQGVEDWDRYKATFGEGSRRNVVYITAQPRGGNVLTASLLAEAARFDKLVRDELYMYSFKDSDWTTPENTTFRDLCVRGVGSSSSCLNNLYPLELFMFANGTFNFAFSDAEILDIVNSRKGIDPVLFPAAANRSLNIEAVFGGLERDSSGRITSAASLMFTYSVVNAERESRVQKQAIAWEEQLNYFCGPEWTDNPPEDTRGGAYPDKAMAWSSTLINVYPNSAGAINREFRNAIGGDIVALQIGFMCIMAYAYFVLARPRSPLRSRANLATAGVISCGLAIAVAYSVGALFVKLNTVVNVLPFVLIGIGVDDMFVLINSIEAVPTDVPAKERVARGIANAGVSITITSLTDFMAFLLGSSSALPGLAAFCIFAAIGILADFTLQITFFAGWMALDAYREDAGKSDCCCCPCASKEPTKEGAGACKWYPRLQDLNDKYYVPLLRKPVVKAVVLVFFFGFLGICGWQASNLQQDFDRRWFVDGDVQLQEAFTISDEYYTNTGSDGPGVNIVSPSSAEFDYTLTASQQKIVALSQAVTANKWIVSASPWYPQLKAWTYACVSSHTVNGMTCVGASCAVGGELLFPYCTTQKYRRSSTGDLIMDANGKPISTGADNKTMVLADGSTAPIDTALDKVYLPPASFYAYLDQFIYDSAAGPRFASYMKWNVNNVGNLSLSEINQGLAASQFRATYLYLDKSSDQVDSMRDLRKDIEAVGVGEGTATYPITFIFIFFEQFAIIGREALLNLTLALIAVFFITTAIIGSLHGSLMVILCVIMVDVDILGLMYMWDLTIDSVTIINLVLAVGLAVDYSAHVAHAFVVAKGTKQERADKALSEMGTAVVHGALSTFAAVLVLGSSQSYVFRVFFKQFFGICIFGAAHGLLFLPVVLSLVGPEELEGLDAHTETPSKAAPPASKQDNTVD